MSHWSRFNHETSSPSDVGDGALHRENQLKPGLVAAQNSEQREKWTYQFKDIDDKLTKKTGKTEAERVSENSISGNASIKSIEKAVDAQQEFPDHITPEFAIMLYKDAKPSPYSSKNLRYLAESLPMLLKDFSVKLSVAYEGQGLEGAIWFVHQKAHSISLAFLIAMRRLLSPEVHREDMHIKTSVQDQAAYFDLDTLIDKFANSSAQQLCEEKKYLLDKQPWLNFQNVLKRTNRIKGHEWLLGRIRAITSLEHDSNSSLAAVTKEIERIPSQEGLNAKNLATICFCTFIVEESLLDFLERYYGESNTKDLTSVVVLTAGDPQSGVQAATIEQYMEQTWPVTGVQTLHALQEAAFQSSYEGRTRDGSKLECTINHETIMLSAISTKRGLVEIGEQLAWLCATMRSPNKMEIRHSTFTIGKVIEISHAGKNSETPTTRIHVFSKVLRVMTESFQENGCWLELFQDPVIACGYPILARTQDEKGLEIPLDLMAELGDAKYWTDFRGMRILKGFSTMFVATKLSARSIQWHFLCDEEGNRISYNLAFRHGVTFRDSDMSNEPIMLSESLGSASEEAASTLSSSILREVRNFVGWTSSVRRLAGTSEVRYNEINWSKLDYCGSGYALTRGSLNAGQYITTGVQIGRGMRNRRIVDKSDRYYDEGVNFMRQHVRINLYDVGDRRGWLLDGASAVFHLARTQLTHPDSPHSTDAQIDLSVFQHASHDGGAEAAVLALKANRHLVVNQSTIETLIERREEDDSKTSTARTTKSKLYRFEDLVQGNLNLIEKMYDYLNLVMDVDGIELRAWDRGKLDGWDFVEMVSCAKSLKPRVYNLSSSSRGWADFTKHIHTINLFADGFGALLEPTKDCKILCEHWTQVPKQKDFLAVCVSTLDEICRRYGDSQGTPFKLAHDVYWHKPHLLFENCHCPTTAGYCDRVQVLLPRTRTQKAQLMRPEPFEQPNGAIIFGQSRVLIFPWTFPIKGSPCEDANPAEVESTDGERRLKRVLQDSGLGERHRPRPFKLLRNAAGNSVCRRQSA